MEKISAVVNGKDRILAIWEGPQDGELYGIAKATAREIEHTFLNLNRILNNDRLSAEAKRDDRKEAGLDSLRTLAKSAARLEELGTLHQERANRLAAVSPYRDGDAATPLIDMEIARKLAAMNDESARVIMLTTGEQPRLTEAALRLPAFLSGLSDAEHQRVSRAAIERANPIESRAIEQAAQDLNAATGAIKKAFRIIAEQTGAELVTQVGLAGQHAALLVNTAPEAIESIQRRTGNAA